MVDRHVRRVYVAVVVTDQSSLWCRRAASAPVVVVYFSRAARRWFPLDADGHLNSKMAADSGMDTCPSPEIADSRKRPLDGDAENGDTKRSHFSSGKGGAAPGARPAAAAAAAAAAQHRRRTVKSIAVPWCLSVLRQRGGGWVGVVCVCV